jgi:hypothetical protein
VLSDRWHRRPATARRDDGDVLRAVVHHVQQVETRVQALEAERRAARHDDPVADARLLSAIAITFGESIFTATDLHHASATEVRTALGAATVGRLASGCNGCTDTRCRRTRCAASDGTSAARCG